jgi:hypothetical protein
MRELCEFELWVLDIIACRSVRACACWWSWPTCFHATSTRAGEASVGCWIIRSDFRLNCVLIKDKSQYLMKYTLLILLFSFTFSITIAQKKSKQNYELDDLSTNIKLTENLFDLREVYQHIYLDMTGWVFSLPNQELKHEVEVRYPELKFSTYELANHSKNRSLPDTLNVLFTEVFSQINHANVIMNTLDTYEKYEDSTGTLQSIKQFFLKEVMPQNQKIEHHLAKVLEQRKIEMTLQLNTLLSSNSTKGLLEEIKDLVESTYVMDEVKQYLWEINKNAFLVGYLDDNAFAKVELKRILSNPILYQDSSLHDRTTAAGWFNIPVLKEDLDTLIFTSSKIMQMLDSTSRDYQGRWAKFLVQSKVDDVVHPHYLNLINFIGTDLNACRYRVVALLADPSSNQISKKQADIMRLIQNNRVDFTTVYASVTRKFTKEGNLKAVQTLDNLGEDVLMKSMVPVYEKLFTHAEIKEILKFQSSKTGKKLQQNSFALWVQATEAVSAYVNLIVERNK